MRNYRVVFYHTEKPRTTQWGRTLADGARVFGDTVDIVDHATYEKPLEGYDVAGKMGMGISTKRIMNDYVGAGKHFMYFDKGYVKRQFYWRVSVDAWQPTAYFQRFMRPDTRAKLIGMRWEEYDASTAESYIILAGACQNYSNFFDLGNVNEYNRWVIQNLRNHTNRKIIYRPNPSWYSKHHDEFVPIHKEFENVELSEPETPFDGLLVRGACHLLVTHGSSVCVSAVAAGIPVMVLGPGVAAPVGLTKQWDQVEQPYWPRVWERKQFFSDLAYTQWTRDEVANGKAWEEIRRTFAALEPSSPEGVEEIIKQYQLMHEHPSYFRGLTTLKYMEQINSLIRLTRSKTLLDYGCGKGEQYKQPHFLQNYWGVAVEKYDPGVPKLSAPPKGGFDGVICCDVMEHIPEEAVQDTLQKILSHAGKFAFFAIATELANKSLPEGLNCHLTVKPKGWWVAQIDQAKNAIKRDVYISVITPQELPSGEK